MDKRLAFGFIILAFGSALLLCRWWWRPVCCNTDGVIRINQQVAEAGGVNPTDTPGFPVTISESGHYRLTGNVTVPDENTMGILITGGDVTLDLNGFVLGGPNTCTKTIVDTQITCASTGSGFGILAPSGGHVTVMNGTVRGFGNDGVSLAGASARIERVTAYHNGAVGLLGFQVTNSLAHHNGQGGIAGTLVSGSVANSNGGSGISGRVIRDNRSMYNDQDGIFATAGIVTNNAVHENGRYGVHLPGGVNLANADAVIGNTISENGSYGIFFGQVSVGGYVHNVLSNNGNTVIRGVQMGPNVCNGNTVCP